MKRGGELKRRQGLRRARPEPRRKPLARGKPIKKVNPARRAANHERAYGKKLAWIHSLKCVICGIRHCTEAAHTRTGGMGRKADAKWLLPMCGTHPFTPFGHPPAEGCHRLLHRIGKQSFERRFGADLDALAEQYESAWQAHVAAQEGR